MSGRARRVALASTVAEAPAPGQLLRACLLVAQGEFPDVDFAACQASVSEFATATRARIQDDEAPAEALAHVLHTSAGFVGDRSTYDAPENSYLNCVMERGRGLPILLAVLWVETARAAGIPAAGIGLPGHFVASVGAGHGSVLVDPFGGGRVLTRAQAAAIADRAGSGATLDAWLHPVDAQHWTLRVLANLAGSFERRGDLTRLDRTLSDQLAIRPDATGLLARRGEVRARAGRVHDALADLNVALSRLAPGAEYDRLRDRAVRLARLGTPEN